MTWTWLPLLFVLSCVTAQTKTLLLETFDSPAGFTSTNLLGPVAFYSDGKSDYFGINKGDGASYFSCPSPTTTPVYGTRVCPDKTWVGTDNVPSSASPYTGFNGGYFEAEDIDGWDGKFVISMPVTLTWTVSGACAGTLVFSGKFAEDGTANIDHNDLVRVQTSVDGAIPETILEFRGNDKADYSDGVFAVDTNNDKVGDGTRLTLNAATFTASIPGTMTSSVVLLVTLRVGGSGEEIAMDDLQITCGPTIASPPAPPSPPVYASPPLLLETFDSPAGFNTSAPKNGLAGGLEVIPFFSDGLSDYFGINNGMGASTFSGFGGPGAVPGTDDVNFNSEHYTGFDGAFLEAEDIDGEQYDAPFTMTWAPVAGSCAELVFSGKFAMGLWRSIDSTDFVRVQTSIDGYTPQTILEFRGNDEGTFQRLADNKTFETDTSGNWIGLSDHARTFWATIPGNMRASVVLSVTISVNQINEEIAMDDLAINCAPPSPRLPEETVVLTLTASGSVSDYADTSRLQQRVATAGGIDKSLVTISVAAASVIITATITVPASTAAEVLNSLTSALSTAATASDVLGIPVESVPTVAVASSASPKEAPQAQSTQNGADVGAIIGGIVGGVVALAGLAAAAYCWHIRRRPSTPRPAPEAMRPTAKPNAAMGVPVEMVATAGKADDRTSA